MEAENFSIVFKGDDLVRMVMVLERHDVPGMKGSAPSLTRPINFYAPFRNHHIVLLGLNMIMHAYAVTLFGENVLQAKQVTVNKNLPSKLRHR